MYDCVESFVHLIDLRLEHLFYFISLYIQLSSVVVVRARSRTVQSVCDVHASATTRALARGFAWKCLLSLSSAIKYDSRWGFSFACFVQKHRETLCGRHRQHRRSNNFLNRLLCAFVLYISCVQLASLSLAWCIEHWPIRWTSIIIDKSTKSQHIWALATHPFTWYTNFARY